MASANVPILKRPSESNVDDASVPTPKRTSNNNVDDINDKKDKMIQSLKDNPTSALALSKLLSCDACKSLARAPIRYCASMWSGTGVPHTICSICYTNRGEKCPAEGCTRVLTCKTSVNEELTNTIRAMKLPVQCRNRKNGCPEKGEEKEVEEHEIECEFRIVNPKWIAGEEKQFKDLRLHITKQAIANDRKWRLYNKNKDGKMYSQAFRNSIDHDGHIFCTFLNVLFSPSIFVAYCIVIGGERVANKYRVELRLNSSEKKFTTTHHGPVLSVDVEEPWKHEDVFVMDTKRFALFNKGFGSFGDHNKDKNGEINVPIMVKIIKKELDIPKNE